MKYFIPVILVITLISCKGNKATVKNDPPVKPADTLIKQTIVEPVVAEIIMQNESYDNFDSFWVSFKDAAAKQDRAKIMRLTALPFLQNGEAITRDEFSLHWLEQVFGIEKTKGVPVIFDVPNYLGLDVKYDSIYYINFGDKEVYFGKMDSIYKLISVRTPG